MSVEASQFLLFLVLNAIVLLNALWLTCLFGGWKTWSERLLDVALYAAVLIVVGFQVLHFARWVSLDGLFVVHILVAVALGLVARRRGWDVRDFFTLDPVRGLRWHGQLLLCVFVAWLLAYLFYCRYLPPRGTDAIVYHLTKTVHWLKAGDLSMVSMWWADPNIPYAPIHGDLLMLWWLTPFGNDVAARFSQTLFLPVTMLVLYNLWRRWNAPVWLALGGAGLVLIFRPFLRQIVLPNVDLMIVAWLLVFLHYWQRLETNWRSWAACGLALGMMVGTKILGLIYLAPCLLLLVVKQLDLRRLSAARCGWRGWSVLVGTAVALGGFTYFRNWIVTGNPIYPAIFKLFGLHVFPGVFDSDAMAATNFRPGTIFDFLFVRRDAFAMLPWTAAIWGVAVAATPLVWWFRRAEREPIWLWAHIILSAILFFWKVPYLDNRLVFPTYAIGLTLVGWLVIRVNGVWPAWGAALMLGGIAVCFGVESIEIGPIARWCVWASAVLFPCLLGLLYGRRLLPPIRAGAWIALLLVVVLALAAFVWAPYVQRYQTVKFLLYPPVYPQHGPAWVWLNEQTRARGMTVTYTGSELIYPLFGQDLQNDVTYLSVEKTPHRFLHETGAPVASGVDSDLAFRGHVRRSVRDDPDAGVWLQRILESSADFLVVVRNVEPEPIELLWAERQPELFSKVFEHGVVTIYRVAATGQ